MRKDDRSDGESQDAFACDVPTAFRLPPPGEEFDLDKYPVAAPLPAFPATLPPRPRLILTPDRLAAIHADLEHGFLQTVWPTLWDEHLQYGPQRPAEGTAPLREYGYALTWRALRFAVTRQDAALQEATDWLRAVTRCAITSHRDSLVPTDVVSAVALALDWLHDDLPPDLAAEARRWMAVQAAQSARAAASGAVWWADTWLQNHTIVNECGIVLAGMALADAPEESLRRTGLQLYQHALTALRKAVFYQPPDGSTPELCRYAYFMAEAQFIAFEALRTFSSEDLYGSFARRRIDYILHQIIPAPTGQADILNWGDNDRSCWPHPPTNLLYCLARRFNDPVAQRRSRLAALARRRRRAQQVLAGPADARPVLIAGGLPAAW